MQKGYRSIWSRTPQFPVWCNSLLKVLNQLYSGQSLWDTVCMCKIAEFSVHVKGSAVEGNLLHVFSHFCVVHLVLSRDMLNISVVLFSFIQLDDILHHNSSNPQKATRCQRHYALGFFPRIREHGTWFRRSSDCRPAVIVRCVIRLDGKT